MSFSTPTCKYVINAPKLSCFELCTLRVPVLSTKDGFPCLKEMDFGISISDKSWKEYNMDEKKQEMLKLISLFREFRETKFLTISFGTIKVLSRCLDHLRGQSSPFVKLKSLNLRSYVEETTRTTTNPTKSTNNVINYFLNGSPGVKIFVEEDKDSELRYRSYNPKEDMLFGWTYGLCIVKVREKMAFMKPAQSNVQAMSQGLGVIPPATVHSEIKSQTSSCSNDDSFSLWEGHRVHSEYVDLLTYIKRNHPETFKHFTLQTDIINTLGLNTLCSLVRALSEVSKSSFTALTVTRYRGLFTDLERWGFNTTWLLNILNNADEF